MAVTHMNDGSCRLKSLVLEMLPVASNVPAPAAADDEASKSPVRKVLRSKGFMWMDGEHNNAYYWSHAGQHFEIRDEGDWCARAPCAVKPDSHHSYGCNSHPHGLS